MKKIKVIISVLLAVALVVSLFTACKGNGGKDTKGTTVVAVTDENGKEVTDKNGKVVTTVINIGDEDSDSEGGVVVVDGKDSNGSNGGAIDLGENKDKGKGSAKKTTKDTKTTKAQNNKKSKKKKPAAPSAPSGLTASNVTKDSLVLSWKGVKCDGYELGYKSEGKNWETLKDSVTAVKIPLTGLNSYTNYSFRVRAFNQNSAGRSASKWIETSVKTKPDESNRRYLKVKIRLPMDSNKKDKLQVFINGKLDHEEEIHCNGKTISYQTEKKYEGVVVVKGVLREHKSRFETRTDKDTCALDLSAIGIDAEVDLEGF